MMIIIVRIMEFVQLGAFFWSVTVLQGLLVTNVRILVREYLLLYKDFSS